MHGSRNLSFYFMLAFFTGILACIFLAFRASATKPITSNVHVPTHGSVTDSQNRPIAGATVYFIDSQLIDVTSPMTASGILDGSTESFDEPLEDIVRDPVKSAKLPKAVTNHAGKFSVHALKASSNYYAFVMPGTQDSDHLPGGDLSRFSFSTGALTRTGIHITLSWKPPDDATYIGTSACYTCHRLETYKRHAHQIGLQVPAQRTNNQDISVYPSIDDFTSLFTDATSYTDPGVKVLFYEDYNPLNDTDKFKVFQDATGGGLVYMQVYLWKTGTQYKVTLFNQLNPSDTPLTLNVKLTYGGAFYRQLLLVDAPGRKGRYPFLQFQSFSGQLSAGDDSYYDTSRHVFRDYGGGTFFSAGPDGIFGTSDDVLTLPPVTETFEGQCAGCHFTGVKIFKDATTQEILANAVPDENGAFDPDGSGSLQEINVGCESCHGPGSRHREEAPLNAAQPKSVARDSGARAVSRSIGFPTLPGAHIVQPAFLGADRASMICGSCHEQVLGKSQLGVREVPLDANEQFPRPGISRAEYLANHTSRKSFPLDALWTDQIHPKIHRAQYSTWLKSKHARNARIMVACDDCHKPHADSEFVRFLFDDPHKSDSLLCQRCHAIDVTSHSLQEAGDVMLKDIMRCTDCHMDRTARSGPGNFGHLLGLPNGVPGDQNIVFWENDLTSHVMDVPRKIQAAGVPPGLAMPVPYTRSCASSACHDTTKLIAPPPP